MIAEGQAAAWLLCISGAALAVSQLARARLWVGVAAGAISAFASGIMLVDGMSLGLRAAVAVPACVAAILSVRGARALPDASESNQALIALWVLIATEACIVLALLGREFLHAVTRMGH